MKGSDVLLNVLPMQGDIVLLVAILEHLIKLPDIASKKRDAW